MTRVALVTSLIFAACGEPSPPGAGALAGAVAADELAPALARLGERDAFETTAARPYQALGCARGEVEGLDVLVCHYADEAKAEAATSSLREFVQGALSGLVRRSGSDLMAVADRKQVDPKGERISRLARAFVPAP